MNNGVFYAFKIQSLKLENISIELYFYARYDKRDRRQKRGKVADDKISCRSNLWTIFVIWKYGITNNTYVAHFTSITYYTVDIEHWTWRDERQHDTIHDTRYIVHSLQPNTRLLSVITVHLSLELRDAFEIGALFFQQKRRKTKDETRKEIKTNSDQLVLVLVQALDDGQNTNPWPRAKPNWNQN